MRGGIAVVLLCAFVACGGDDTSGPSAKADPITVLRAIPGASNVTAVGAAGGPPTYELYFGVPVDHDDSTSASMGLAILVTHVDFDAPVVAITDGYDIEFATTDANNNTVSVPFEPATIFGANQIEIEHRYFDSSVPAGFDTDVFDTDPASLAHVLTLHQSIEDIHAVITAFKQAYTGAWISAGGSNDGDHALAHRSVYPDDVVATIAYSSAFSHGLDDPRYIPFIENDGTADCRAAITAFQRGVLTRRADVAPALQALAQTDATTFGVTFEAATGAWDEILEDLMVELPFVFWQYTGLPGCAEIPDATWATPHDIALFIDKVQPLVDVSDQSLVEFEPYDFMSDTELGTPADDTSHISDLLVYTESDDSFPVPFDPVPVQTIEAWVAGSADHVMLTYGELDPWRAGAMTVGGGDDAQFVIAGGVHTSLIGDMPADQQTAALSALARWVGVDVATLVTPPPFRQEDAVRQPLRPH